MKFGVNAGRDYGLGNVEWMDIAYNVLDSKEEAEDIAKSYNEPYEAKVENVVFVVFIDVGSTKMVMANSSGQFCFQNDMDAARLASNALTTYVNLYELGLLPACPKVRVESYFESMVGRTALKMSTMY